jgi:hypothetical protein
MVFEIKVGEKAVCISYKKEKTKDFDNYREGLKKLSNNGLDSSIEVVLLDYKDSNRILPAEIGNLAILLHKTSLPVKVNATKNVQLIFESTGITKLKHFSLYQNQSDYDAEYKRYFQK